MNRKRKILVLGAKGYEFANESRKVFCVEWNSTANIQNIRDYDVLILNLLSLSDEDKKDLPWQDIFRKLSYKSCLDIIKNQGRIYILGDPRFKVGILDEETNEKTEIPFLSWTGIDYYWDSEPGDSKEYVNDYDHRVYYEYVENLKKWFYSLRLCRINQETVEANFDISTLFFIRDKLDIEIDKICRNRYNNAVLFSIIYKFYSGQDFISFGPIVFLPQISLNEDETLQLILRDLCGVEAELPEPEWLTEFHAPGQSNIDKKIDLIKSNIQKELVELKEAEKEKNKIRECLKLLYEREYALEPVVRNILRTLGAYVEDPNEPNKEDGWITIKIDDGFFEGVLEIKSTKSDTFNEDGRKQLLDWIDRGRTTREKNYKGIFIGNSAVNKPVKERPWAFSDSWTKAAELSSICAVKTEDLYLIYLLHCDKKLDIDSFWRDLFATNGMFDMKKYIELFNPEDKKNEKG